MSAGFFWLLKHRDLNVSPFLSTPNSSAFSEPKESGDIQVAECKWGLYGNFFLGLLIQIKVKLGEFGNFKSINSVTQSCPTLCDPMNRTTLGLPVHDQLPESTQTHVHWVGDAIQPSHPLSSPSPPAHNLSQHQGLLQWLRWPKYWSFSFNISPSNEHPGLISFRMDWLDLHAVPGTLKSLLQHHSSKASILLRSAFFTVQIWHPYMTTGKTIALTRRLLCWQSNVSAF